MFNNYISDAISKAEKHLSDFLATKEGVKFSQDANLEEVLNSDGFTSSIVNGRGETVILVEHYTNHYIVKMDDFRLIAHKDGANVSRRFYDKDVPSRVEHFCNNLIVQKDYYNTDGIPSADVFYEYDGNNRLVEEKHIHYPSDSDIEFTYKYEYDNFGRQICQYENGNLLILTTYSNDVKTEEYANGLVITYLDDTEMLVEDSGEIIKQKMLVAKDTFLCKNVYKEMYIEKTDSSGTLFVYHDAITKKFYFKGHRIGDVYCKNGVFSGDVHFWLDEIVECLSLPF